METLEMADIQGYIIRGYKHMKFSRYGLLQVTDAAAAKKFIFSIAGKLTNGTHFPKKTCLNIAFTAAGLRALGVSEKNMANFIREFREGMTTPHRQRLLGDHGSSAPEQWRWGGPNNEELHILLMVFGKKPKETALDYYSQLKEQFLQSGLKEVGYIDGCTLRDNKEFFGFRDGISQPIIKGSGREGNPHNIINAGEFLMGYKNEYKVYPDTPLLAEEQGNSDLLPLDAGGTGKKDLGRNGTYMVLRQMEQHVDGYWSFLNERTKNEDGSINVGESTKLAAKMMGRWPSGAPVTKYPDKDPFPHGNCDDDDFGYYHTDKDGLGCPFGSHLRRCNPRDQFEDNGPKESSRLTRRHRIIRRARLYGEPYISSAANHTPNGEVGLVFTCFNADISRQFEFVQYTWANYPKCNELYNDPDPIVGIRESNGRPIEQNFTIQAEPVSKVITGLERFITIRGGAYFFFPSVTTIKYLTTI